MNAVSSRDRELTFLSNCCAELAFGEERGVDVLSRFCDNGEFLPLLPFLKRQAQDEARHRDAFAALSLLLPPPRPADRSVGRLFDLLEDLAGTPAAVVAMHGLLETIVHAYLEGCRRFWASMPAAEPVFAAVARDEARHAAFGRRWMSREGKAPALRRSDALLARTTRHLAAAFRVDGGFQQLSPRRRNEYRRVVEGGIALAAVPLARQLAALGLVRTAREVGSLGGP